MAEASRRARAPGIHGGRQSVLQPSRSANRRIARDSCRDHSPEIVQIRPRRLWLAPALSAITFRQILHAFARRRQIDAEFFAQRSDIAGVIGSDERDGIAREYRLG